jgi:glycosyltransferase involved in cell wall biosynthesis
MTGAEAASAQDGPVAYLTGEYPKVSHTFIAREVAALRAQGLKVLTCTVRRAAPKDVVGPDQKAEAATTFCVLETARAPLRLVGAHLGLLARSPGRWFAALRLAWATRSPGLRAHLWQLFYFAEAGVLARYLQARGVVHLHNHFSDSSCSVTMLTSAMTAIPFSVTIHGPAELLEPRRWRLDEKIARARFVACISHFCRSQAMLFSDQAHWGKLRIVHCGVTPANYGTRPRGDFGQHVLFVGRLDAVKGVPLLLEAFASARSRHPDARLTVVGDGPARAALEAQALALGIAGATTFTGYKAQAEVAALLEEADMLVLPSFAEGLPVVLMEAMASRIPVIASGVAGVPELVQDGISGFVVPAGDVETLTARLEKLLADPDLCRRMGEAGRAKVEEEFDVEREAAWLAQILRDGGVGLRPMAGASGGQSPVALAQGTHDVG